MRRPKYRLELNRGYSLTRRQQFGPKSFRKTEGGGLSRRVKRSVKRAGLENVRFHDLRHIFVSLMLLCGVKPKVISEALGHASVAFTMDTYSHIIEGMQEDAMALLDEVLPAGISQKNNANLTPKVDITLQISEGLASMPA